jgi:hypothetical protein
MGSPLSWNDFTKAGSWSETGRRAVVWKAPKAAYRSDAGHTNFDAWIGAKGEVWWGAFPANLGFGKHDGPKTRHFVIDRGKRLRLKRGSATYQSYYFAPGVSVSQTTPNPDVYAHVVELALQHAQEAARKT